MSSVPKSYSFDTPGFSALEENENHQAEVNASAVLQRQGEGSSTAAQNAEQPASLNDLASEYGSAGTAHLETLPKELQYNIAGLS